jgi:hypothetical protein
MRIEGNNVRATEGSHCWIRMSMGGGEERKLLLVRV